MKGKRQNGTLKKGYKYKKGGAIVKAKAARKTSRRRRRVKRARTLL